MSDAVLRYLAMLRRVPRQPGKIDARSLQEALQREGFDVSVRTVERDLQKLSRRLPLVADERSRPYGWSFLRDTDVSDIPAMDSALALTLKVAEEFLRPMLPANALDAVEPHFRRAGAVLDALAPGLRSWPDRIRVVPRGQPLLPPALNSEAAAAVYEALARGRRARIIYDSRSARDRQDAPGEHEINPLGIVVRDQVIYVVCTFWEYTDIRQIALHRVESAEVLEQKSTQPTEFDLDRYIAEGAFQYPESGETIELQAAFTEDAAFHLRETPLSEDQRMEEMEDGRVLVTATVADTAQLRWWLLGFGDGVEVLLPSHVRRQFTGLAERLQQMYK